MTRPLTMRLVVPTTGPYVSTLNTPSQVAVYDATEGEEAGFLYKCQQAYEHLACEDIIGYCHSDLIVHEDGWAQRVLKEFEWPTTAVVGFVGATRLGADDIYRVPYDYRQLARGDVWSNLTDAEAHGQRTTGTRAVAVLDSCAIFVRRSFLQRVGGWPIGRLPNTSHCSDLWVCATAHRLGRQVRMVGVSVTHASGGKGDAGSRWLDKRGGDTFCHREAHKATYDLLRGVLPLRVR